MKILLMTAPSLKVQTRWNKTLAQPPIGLCYIAGVLEKEGIPVEILDSFAQNLTLTDIRKEIIKRKPDIIGINLSYAVFYNNAKGLSDLIKEVDPKIITVVGGAHLFLNYVQTMKDMPSIDFAIRGEGEFSFLELIKAIEHKTSLNEIKGLVFRHNKEIKVNPPREWIADLDALPLPARYLLDITSEVYGHAFRYKQLPVAGVITSRGCPYQCIFCDRVFGKKFRAHSAKRVVEEVKSLVRDYGFREILFMDDNFLVDIERVKKICVLLKKENLDITWSCQGRIDTISSHPEIVPIIKAAGCWYISLGIESGNQSVLKYIKKNITLNQVKKAINELNKHGIITKGYFMIGHPIDTKETIEDTINFAKTLKLDTVQFSLTVPYPGTHLYEIALRTGEVDKDAYERLSSHSEAPVYVPHGLTKEDLIRLQRKAYRSFYFRPSYMLRQVKNINDWISFKKYSSHFFMYVKKIFFPKMKKS